MTIGGEIVEGDERVNQFAAFFANKVKTITDSVRVDPTVFNGERKLAAVDSMFMSRSEVEMCIKTSDNYQADIPPLKMLQKQVAWR